MLKLLQSRLQYKLMLGFSLVLLVALTITTSYTQLRVRDILISRARDEQMRLVATRAAAAERLLADISTDLLFLTQNSTLEHYDQVADESVDLDDISKILLGFLARSGPRYLQICLADEAGWDRSCARMVAGRPVLASAEPRIPSATPRRASSHPERLQDRPTVHISAIDWLSPQGAAGTPTAILRYSVALHDETGRSIGQLFLDVAAQSIFDLLVDPVSTTRTVIVDHSGAYVFGPPAGSLLRDRPASAAQIFGRPGGAIFGAADAPGDFTTFHELAFPDQRLPPWTVIYDQPLDIILDPIDQTLIVNSALTAALLLAGLFVAYMLTRSIVRPIRALAVAAERVGAGDLQTPIEVSGHDEIGALASTLARTVERLRITLDGADARRREAETLYATAIALSSTLDLHRLLDRILDELHAVVPYDSSTVQLVRGDQVEIIGAYGLARPENLIGTCFPITGSGPNAEVARQRTTLILDDAPAVYPLFNDELYQADPIRSWLGVPLIFGERLIGMITIDKYEPGFYNPGHARLASAFAAQAAIALENARLYEAARDELAERRRSELAQMRLSAILEATTDVVGSVDTEGRMLFLNRAGRRLLGVGEHEQIIGRPMGDYIPGEPLAQMMREAVPSAIRDGIWSGDLTLRRSDGDDIPTSQVIIAHRDADGQTAYFSTIIRDISEQLHAEEQLRQAQKMEAVGRLAGGVSHDFNNILTVIMGECDLLLLGEAVSGDLRQGLEQIRQASVRAAALTHQLLAFSRRQVLQLAKVNLNEIIPPIEQMLRRLIGEDVTLRTSLDAHLAAVQADPSQIEQVILNLCINGRDAMPNGGDLCIATANVRIGPGDDRDLASGDYVRLTVSDTGLGIDEDARDHIFEPFFTTKPCGKGTGLGLATVHGIVQQSGGAIRFSSLPGRGTSFAVYLPALAGPSAPMPAPSQASIPRPTAAGSVVALVEDDDRVRQLARQILSAQGLTVIEAADGAEALRTCAAYEGRIDLLLSDVVMPGGINGVQLAARIRAARPQIKVLLMSGYTDDALSTSGGITPGMHFIQKPFTPAQLLEKIYEALAVAA